MSTEPRRRRDLLIAGRSAEPQQKQTAQQEKESAAKTESFERALSAQKKESAAQTEGFERALSAQRKDMPEQMKESNTQEQARQIAELKADRQRDRQEIAEIKKQLAKVVASTDDVSVDVDVGGGQGQLLKQSTLNSQSSSTSQASGQGQTSESARLQALEQQIGTALPLLAQHNELHAQAEHRYEEQDQRQLALGRALKNTEQKHAATMLALDRRGVISRLSIVAAVPDVDDLAEREEHAAAILTNRAAEKTAAEEANTEKRLLTKTAAASGGGELVKNRKALFSKTQQGTDQTPLRKQQLRELLQSKPSLLSSVVRAGTELMLSLDDLTDTEVRKKLQQLEDERDNHDSRTRELEEQRGATKESE